MHEVEFLSQLLQDLFLPLKHFFEALKMFERQNQSRACALQLLPGVELFLGLLNLVLSLKLNRVFPNLSC